MSFVYSPLRRFSRQSPLWTIGNDHFFADATERDAWFTSNPGDYQVGIIISVGAGYQLWSGTAWIDKTALVQGRSGIPSRQQVEAAEDIASGKPVRVASNALCYLSSANQVHGLASEGANATFSATIQSIGTLELADWSASTGNVTLTPGANYFNDQATPGMLTTTVPTTGYVLSVGKALSLYTFDINPSQPVRL